MTAGASAVQRRIPSTESPPGLDPAKRLATQSRHAVSAGIDGRGARLGVHALYNLRWMNSVELVYPTWVWYMSHVATEKAKLLNRVRRLRGQIEAIERAVEADDECADVLQQATSCRGALDGFIAEVIEDHIREHLVDPNAGRETPQALAAEELIEIVHQYLKK